MASIQQSFDNLGLHRAAAVGDEEAIQLALLSGADVNALDATGKTALMCAIAGENWDSLDTSDASFMTAERLSIIRTMVKHPNVSLLTLNAPHSSMNGVVPLGMAAWLNLPGVVRLLLEESSDAVSVDGMDSHGATALMYAARDGNMEVVQLLLSHGGRPDFRDRNHRTSIQFALLHPQILWLCETVLRRHRWRESRSADRQQVFSISEHIVELSSYALPSSDDLEPPHLSIFTKEATSRLLDTLITSIRNGDLAFIHSLLFSPPILASSPPSLYPMSVPVLVNLPDAKGWSLIHHCLSSEHPSIEVLDSLYCAGADMALFTTKEQWTPLHVLSLSASLEPGQHDQALSLYNLVVHLIRDLRAPLSARDKNEETCIHTAAKHGRSLELLMYLLSFDKTGTIRQFKNSQGLTAMQLAKPEFLVAFRPDATHQISTSLSSRPILPNDSLSSLASLSESSDYLVTQDDSSSICSPTQLDAALTSQLLIANLRLTSTSGRHVNDVAHIRQFEHLVAESKQQSQNLVQCFRDRINEAEKELDELKKNTERIALLRNAVSHAARGKLAVRGIRPDPPKHYHRDSEDSQSTAVSRFSDELAPNLPQLPHLSHHEQAGLRVSTKSGDLGLRSSTTALSGLFHHLDSPTTPLSMYKQHVDDVFNVKAEVRGYRDSQLLAGKSTPDLRSLNHDAVYTTSPKKKKKAEEKARDLESLRKADKPPSGTMRFKAWLKRIVIPSHHNQSMETASPSSDRQEYQIYSRTEAFLPTISLTFPSEAGTLDVFINRALRTSEVVLDAAECDLHRIQQSLASAQRFIEMANHSVTKVERATKSALKKRKTMITKLRSSDPGTQWHEGDLIQFDSYSPGLLGYSNALSLRPSIASISSIQSTHSSIASAAATVTEHDDEDTRVIRRLVLRKIEAQTSGAWDEIEKVIAWLRVIKEVVRGVKRRAYL